MKLIRWVCAALAALTAAIVLAQVSGTGVSNTPITASTLPAILGCATNHVLYNNPSNVINCTGKLAWNNSTGILTTNNVPFFSGFSGTTGSIGGGALGAGACTSGTVTTTGATTSMVAVASPNTYPGDGIVWDAQVTSADTVTVKVCAITALTPTASTYNVRVIQ